MRKKLFMIGNAHLDPVWLWRWQDGYAAVRATFRSVLERMKEYPYFIFTSASVCYYEWIEQCDPAMFEEIRKRVKEGRWKIVGGWWIQPDCNLPSGESFARQALIGQSYLMEKFGITARTGYNVDSFGHSGSLPKILKLSGMDRYVYMRPGLHERSYPAWLFRWQSPEGEEVTAFRIPYAYCTWPEELSAHIDNCAKEITDENGMMCFYGVGNHGGGPTKKNIESIEEFNGKGGIELKFSDPDEFFDEVKGSLPVVSGDLLHHASGCYSAHSGIKLWNRLAENRLLSAEKWSTISAIFFGGRDHRAELRTAWKKVLFNQFHDILAGTCIKEGYEDARQDYGYALSTADRAENEALQLIAGRIKIPFVEGAEHYIVFNPHAFPAEAPVHIERNTLTGNEIFLDSKGCGVAWQKSTASAAANWRSKFCFVAKVPPMGWSGYTLLPSSDEKKGVTFRNLDEFVLENTFLRVEFAPESGEICAIIDRTNGENLLKEPSALCSFQDDSDTWSHAKFVFTGVPDKIKLVGLRKTEEGPVFSTIRVKQSLGNGSEIVRDYTLYEGIPELRIHFRINWNETQKCLKMVLPLNLDHLQVRAQAPFGYADRETDGKEYPMQEWVDVSGSLPSPDGLPFGLAVLNNGKYSYDVHDGKLYITLLRSPYYANHEPMVVSMGSDEYPVIDHEPQEFDLALFPHEGDRVMPFLDQRAALLNAPLQTLAEYAHDGDLGITGSMVELKGNAMLDALKFAEDGSQDIIIHIHETARQESEAELRLINWKQMFPLRLKPGQIQSWRFSANGSTKKRIDLLEREFDKKQHT